MKENLAAEQLDRCERKEREIHKVRNGIPQRKEADMERKITGGRVEYYKDALSQAHDTASAFLQLIL